MLRALLAIALALPSLTAEDRVVGGPYLIHVGPYSATVAWVRQSDPGGQIRSEKVVVGGLKPGTVQHYSKPGYDEVTFRTAPTGASASEFVVYGDTRTGHEAHRSVVAAILGYSKPEFVIHTGDLVADGRNQSLWPIFFDIERELLKKVAFYPVPGNHERNDKSFYELFDETVPYSSFDWGNMHFALIDSDIGNMPDKEEFWSRQTRWLEEDLAKSSHAAFRFVVAHHPPLTAVARRVGGNKEMAALMPLFEKYKVTAGFFGHDHAYEHFLKNGVHYVVTGGGGAPQYAVDAPPEGVTVKVLTAYNFVRVRNDGKHVTFDALGIDGKLIDGFTIGSQQE